MQLLVEHSGTPGTLYSDCLLYDGGCGILNEMDLHETTDNGIKSMKFRGKFQEAEAVNKNKRMYPFSVLDVNVKRLQESIDQGGLLGECDHPTDSIIHFANCSHKITKLWWDNNTLMGEGVILNTPMGKLLKALINDGVRIGISSRGVGNGKVNEEGILVIGESYKLITFDAVADPSTYAAFQEKVVGTAREAVIPTQISNNVVKNETSSIDKNISEVFMLYASSLIKEQINKIKEGLNS